MYHIQSIFIQNFRSISSEKISFGKNKTVFVGKNGSGKTVCLKAIEKLLNSKKIKKKDFKDKNQKLVLRVIVLYNQENIVLELNSIFDGKDVITRNNFSEKRQKDFLDNLNVIYIPSDRKINKNNKENGYLKLIDLILNTKEKGVEEIVKKAHSKLEILNTKPGRKKTTLLVSLFRLYMYSVRYFKNKGFTIFLIDQPENFLHPHATKLIDSILQEIGELESSKVFYSTHSPELVSNFKKGKYEISDIVFVKNEKGSTHLKKIENSQGKYNRIMISLIFKNASMFFSDAIILVEGETEKISIPNMYENINLDKYSHNNLRNLSSEKLENYFNLNYKNISIVDVGGKGALYDWYLFASELFGKQNVVALIDRDENYFIDRDMIMKSIKSVYKVKKVYENDFEKYNWFVLDGEFENYYKIEVIRGFLQNAIRRRAEKFGSHFDNNKFNASLRNLDGKIDRLRDAKKISVIYESIFNSYFRKSSKPTIAFNLSIWLSKNSGYKKGLLKILAKIIEKLDS